MQKKFIGLSKAQISSAIESADLRVFLLVIFHLTGDKSWLQEPYLASRDVRLIGVESAGFSEHIQAVIRAEAVKLLSAEELTAVVEDPGDELMLTLMQTCLGERIPAEYAPMMREQMGFCSPLEDIPVTASSALKRKPVVIVGAGVSGLAMGTTLKQLNIPFIIVEKNAEVGGTWWQNRYPGCGVDTPNHAYSFSFGDRYRWDRYFAPREQLQDYMQHTATAMGLRPSIRLQTEFKKARWNEQKQCWDITICPFSGH